MRSHRFECTSGLVAPPEAVWEHASSPAGVNWELRPLARMVFPRRVTRLEPPDVGGDARPARCWLLLFGVLPVDWDDLGFDAIEPGRWFHERSTMLSQRAWEHERVLVAEERGTRLIDRVHFTPRVPGSGILYRPIFEQIFRHRHRRLRRRFGSRALSFRVESERLVVRPWHHDDLAVLRRLAADARVMRYVGDGSPWTVAQIAEFLARQATALAADGFCLGAVVDRASGEPIGLSGLQRLGSTGEIEIGWWLSPERWGAGLAAEAGRALVRFAFESLRLPRLVAISHPDNAASIHVMERLGMEPLGLTTGRELGLRHPDVEVIVYGLERESR